MLKGVGKGQGKGKGEPEGQGKGKGKGKGKGARVGITYVDPGRQMIFQPTDQDRSHTGNNADYFLRPEKATPQPSVPSTQMRGGRDARLPLASPAADVPEVIDVAPEVIDVDVNHAAEASASESLARILADYGSSSDDTDPSKEVPQVIDVEQYGIILMFLPLPNMTQWLQPLDRVVCGLIKIVQRARRGRHLAADLKQWK